MMKEMKFRDAGALPGGVLRRAEAADDASGMPSECACPSCGLPAVARACRSQRWGTGQRRYSAPPSATVGGVGAAALAPHFKPLGVYFFLSLLDGRGGRGRVPRCAPMPHTRPCARTATTLARRADPTRLRRPPPPSHPPSRPFRLALAGRAEPRACPARRPHCTPAHWLCVLVSGSSSSYFEGSCRWSR